MMDKNIVLVNFKMALSVFYAFGVGGLVAIGGIRAFTLYGLISLIISMPVLFLWVWGLGIVIEIVTRP